MDSLFASPLLHSHSPFRCLHFTAPPLPNRRSLPRRPRNPTSLSSFTFITPPITFAAKATRGPSAPAKQQHNDVSFEQSISECLAKQLVQALFCFAIGFSAFGTFRAAPALAVAAPWAVLWKKNSQKEKAKSHEYSDCTERLLETVSVLLRSIEEVRKGSGDMSEVEVALEAVKAKREESQREIMGGRLYPELRKLRREKGQLMKREAEIIDEVLEAKREYGKLKAKAEEKERVEKLEQRVEELDEEFNGTWEKIGEIEDMMSRKETVALSFGVMEISFIERECEQLVERFKREMRQKDIQKRSHAWIT